MRTGWEQPPSCPPLQWIHVAYHFHHSQRRGLDEEVHSGQMRRNAEGRAIQRRAGSQPKTAGKDSWGTGDGNKEPAILGLESYLHSNSLTSAPEGWVSANSRPGSLRDKEMWSCFLCPPILVRRKRFAQSWALCYADYPQLTQFSFPHPDFPFSTASSEGKWNPVLLCAF